MGGPRAYSIFTPTTASSRWRLRLCWTRHGGDNGEANGRNFRRRRSSLPSVSSFTAMALPQQLHNINSSFQSVIFHAVPGGGGPRRWPLNSSDRHALLARRQLESVLAGSNGDGSIQLRPDGSGASSSAGLAVATAGRHRFLTAMGSRFTIFFCYTRPFSLFGLFIRYMFACFHIRFQCYSAFNR
jgi:hypothetical protein